MMGPTHSVEQVKYFCESSLEELLTPIVHVVMDFSEICLSTEIVVIVIKRLLLHEPSSD